MEAGANKRPVAGFVVVMYDDGAGYVVEKLRNCIGTGSPTNSDTLCEY